MVWPSQDSGLNKMGKELAPFDPNIKALVAGMLSCGMKDIQDEREINHFFCDGMYGRVMNIKAGDLVAGRRHKQASLNILLSGACRVYLKDGDVRNMVSPDIVISEAGAQRAFLAFTDCSWMTILRTDLKDPEEIVNQLTEF